MKEGVYTVKIIVVWFNKRLEESNFSFILGWSSFFALLVGWSIVYLLFKRFCDMFNYCDLKFLSLNFISIIEHLYCFNKFLFFTICADQCQFFSLILYFHTLLRYLHSV